MTKEWGYGVVWTEAKYPDDKWPHDRVSDWLDDFAVAFGAVFDWDTYTAPGASSYFAPGEQLGRIAGDNKEVLVLMTER